MARPRFLFGRAFALLLVGVAIGAALFLKRHLSPAAVEAQVRAALAELIGLPYELDEVRLELGTGVELRGFRARYPDGSLALDIESVGITVDQQALLRGEVSIRQIDFRAPRVHLRRAPGEPMPSMPGLLRARTTASPEPQGDLPAIRVVRGARPSAIRIEGAPAVAESVVLEFEIVSAEGRSDGGLFTADLEIRARGMEAARVALRFDPRSSRADVTLDVRRLSWTPEDLLVLPPATREPFERFALRGRADGTVTLSSTPGSEPRWTVEAQAEGLGADFGGIWLGRPGERRFHLSGGRCSISADPDELTIRDFQAQFAGSLGRAGTLRASVRKELRSPSRSLDLKVRTEGIEITPDEAKMLVPPHLVERIIEKYRPAGRLDLDLSITQRAGLDEKLLVAIGIREGSVSYVGGYEPRLRRRIGFDYPLERVTGTVRVESNVPSAHGKVDRIAIEGMRGRRATRDGGEVTAAASGLIVAYKNPLLDGAEDAAIAIEVRNLPIDENLDAAFRSTERGIPYRNFEMRGRADRIGIRVRREALGDDVTRASYDVRLADCEFAFRPFPLSVGGVTGRIEVRELPPEGALGERTEMRFLDFSGTPPDGGRVSGSGTVTRASDGTEAMELAIRADDFVLGPHLDEVLSTSPSVAPDLLDVWFELRPEGAVDATVSVSSGQDARVAIDLDGTTHLRGYRGIDCPVRDLDGTLEFAEGRLSLRGVSGHLLGGTLEAEGWFSSGLYDFHARIPELEFTPELRDLARSLGGADAWIERLRPLEGSRFDLEIGAARRSAGERPAFELEAHDLAIESGAGPFPIVIRGGPVRYREGRLEARGIEVASGDALLTLLDGEVPLEAGAGGRVLVNAKNLGGGTHLSRLLGAEAGLLFGENLRADFTGIEALFNRADGKIVVTGGLDLRRHQAPGGPPSTALEPTGAFRLAPVTITPPASPDGPVAFSGLILFKGVNFNVPFGLSDVGGQLLVGEGSVGKGISVKGAIHDGSLTVYRRRIEGASMNLDFTPDYLRLREIEGGFYGGRLTGAFEVHLDRPSAFEAQFRIEDADIGKMLRQDLPPGEEMAGRLDAALEFSSPTGSTDHLAGRGEIRVRDGALLEVPTLRTMIAVLGRVTPIKNTKRFRNADVDFELRGESIEVKRLHLSTAVSDIFGRGVVSIFGDLNLVIEPQVNRVLDLPRFLNLPVLSSIRNLWHRTVYEVRLVGTIDSPSLRLRALPFLKVRERLAVTQARHAAQAQSIRPRILPSD